MTRFVREFEQKPWWNSSRMWFAEDDLAATTIGTVTLGELRGSGGHVGAVQWLAVVPQQRRRGIARLLMNHLEREAWERGYRRLELETLGSWTAANAFYESQGWASTY